MPHPRLCCLRIDEEYSGFGFSLVATKNETGQFIDEVRSGSPAARAGLKDGDFVVEVNGENILSLSHSEVVELIRKNPNEVSFLVLDPVSRRHYDECSVVVHGQLPEVQRICSWSDTSCTSPKVSGSSENNHSSEGQVNATSTLPSNEAPRSPTTSEAGGDRPSKTVKPLDPVIQLSDPTQPSKQPKQPNFARSAPSRRARMDASTTFGDRARVFDEL
uniref:PDZ domain-containing protein n=1 Tax=Mesocestoides corti TaxID=53468 RepID=A0A5K3F4C5_MESCO